MTKPTEAQMLLAITALRCGITDALEELEELKPVMDSLWGAGHCFYVQTYEAIKDSLNEAMTTTKEFAESEEEEEDGECESLG